MLVLQRVDQFVRQRRPVDPDRVGVVGNEHDLLAPR
jgi:hypothetical protein